MLLKTRMLVLGAIVSILSGCGGGSDTGTPSTTGTTSGSSSNTGNNGNTSGTGSGTGGNQTGSSGSYALYIKAGLVTILSSPDTGSGATELKVWGYSASETALANEKILPGVLLEARKGQAITVDVKNTLADEHSFTFPNLASNEITSPTSLIQSNETVQYTITPTKAGVYLYEDNGINNVNSSLGLFGALIVRPDESLGNVAWAGGPRFDKEVLWVINDMDYSGWNLTAINNTNGAAVVNTEIYKPEYFLMNGMNGFAAMEDPQTQISGVVGDKILVRIVNAGQYSHSLHFHGNHFEVLSRNGVRLTPFEQIDTINVKPKQTAIIRYTISQEGHYPMHVHTAQMETSNGVYLNGVAAMIIGKP